MKNELIFGNEPYLIRSYREKIIKNISMPEFNLLESEEFTEKERDFARQMPFMGTHRVLILRFGTLAANELLEKYLKEPTAKTELYLFVDEVDRRLSLFKKFPKEGIRQFDKDSDILQKYILGYVKKQGCQIIKQAYDELVQRINYELEDINLYHVFSVLKKLCITGDEITPDLVKRIVQTNEREDVFQLIHMIDEGQKKELFHQADMIIQHGSQNIIGTLSLLLRSYRILYKVNVCGCTLKEAGVHYRTYLPKMTKEQADRGICIIQETINNIKNGRYMQDFALRFCLSKLCQLKNQ